MKSQRRAKRKLPRGAKPVVSDKIYNIYHPELADKIEEAFTSGGIKYYNFKKDHEVRAGRYIIIANFLQEVFFRMDLETLRAYILRITSEIDGTKGQINIGNALEFLGHMKALTNLAFESDTMYRLASAVYFDDKELLNTWDQKHNERKIEGWREDGTLDFFYKRPFSELTGLKNISVTDLRGFLEASVKLKDEYKRVLSSVTPEADSKSSTTPE